LRRQKRHRRSLIGLTGAVQVVSCTRLRRTTTPSGYAPGCSDLPSNEPWHTALNVAAGNGNPALAERLVELGPDPNIADKRYKSTALSWARYLDQPALVELLEPMTRGT
jgi:hypothetical protein